MKVWKLPLKLSRCLSLLKNKDGPVHRTKTEIKDTTRPVYTLLKNQLLETMNNHKKLVIVGDGFAAAAMAIHLLRRGVPSASMTIIGPRAPGRGQAYDCVNPFFRLNIREDLPIVFSDDPLHFARWAEQAVHDAGAKTDAGYFYRRQDFGRYMAELFCHEPGAEKIEQLLHKVVRLDRSASDWALTLDNGESCLAQQVILATGNPPPTWPCAVVDHSPPASKDRVLPHLVENPWPGNYLKEIAPNERVILLGGGLTALDAINALVGQGHRGMVHVISPRPYFPPAQAKWERRREPEWPGDLTPARLIRFMRRYLPAAPTHSTEWQIAWEELRPNLNSIWQKFSAAQRRMLLKRVGWIWSLYRFRASPQTIAAYDQLKAKGQITFALGRAKTIFCEPSGIRVQMSSGADVQGDRIVNCTGVASDPLQRQLIDSQLAAPDALSQSVAVDTRYRVLGPNLQPTQGLWMIGPATMGSLGDVVAASAIAKQAEQLSAQWVA